MAKLFSAGGPARFLGSGLALAFLLGGAACQRGPEAGNAVGGLFGAPGPAANPGANAARPAPATPPAPTTPGGIPPLASPTPDTAGETADAADRRIRIINRTGQTITLIKGSPSSDSNWGQDRIPSSVLNAGASLVVDFEDGNGECIYDLQATLQDGSEITRRSINICQESDWAVTPQS